MKMNRPCKKRNAKSSGPPATSKQKEGSMERREQTRYGVRAPVGFEWIDKGALCRGQGFTRDISSNGMFIYSNSKLPAKADLHVEVSFLSISEGVTNLQLTAKSMVVRVESATIHDKLHGFAILNQSYKLHTGLTSIDEGGLGLKSS
jgi:hypothetical protein